MSAAIWMSAERGCSMDCRAGTESRKGQNSKRKEGAAYKAPLIASPGTLPASLRSATRAHIPALLGISPAALSPPRPPSSSASPPRGFLLELHLLSPPLALPRPFSQARALSVSQTQHTLHPNFKINLRSAHQAISPPRCRARCGATRPAPSAPPHPTCHHDSETFLRRNQHVDGASA